MKPASLQSALSCAVEAARAAGRLLRQNQRAHKKIDAATQHDIKLELDVRCQKRIEHILRRGFPQIPILGEEGVIGDPNAESRWVVDPIDGTVNFAYGIPHCCTAIALQTQTACRHPDRGNLSGQGRRRTSGAFVTMLGVIYDPFCDELWTALRNKPARLNGRIIRASSRAQLAEALVGIGFSKERATLRRMVPVWHELIHRVRKVRSMGSAALGLAYVAAGRLYAYLECGLRIWDIAAGGLLIECAAGLFQTRPLHRPPHAFHVTASNSLLHPKLPPFQ